MLTVKDIMTKPVIMIRSSATVENAIWLMRAKRVRSLIVEKCHEDGNYGIVTEKDIVYKVIAEEKNPSSTRIGSVMRQPCICIPLTATILEASRILSNAGIHRAPVVENHELFGIVSVTDILIKGYAASASSDELAQRIKEALQHAQILDDADAQTEQECDIAWRIFEDMRLGCKTTF
ncbi:MAG: CBS domain-containing protein [Elainellaceae cyanobacterium]